MNKGAVNSEITMPYAQALMSIARDNDAADQVGEEVAGLLEVLAGSDDLAQFLANPLMDADVKKAVLRQVAEDSVSPFFLSFLLLLVDRGRVSLLGEILGQYQALLREINQTVLADVTSAIELSEEQKAEIKQRVAGFTNANNVELSVQVDPSLLGGLIVQVGSQVIDASLRGQLRRIGLQLSSVA